MAFLPHRGDSGFTLGGFLILALLGTFLWKGAPLDSVRPNNFSDETPTGQALYQAPARLWQDPFKVALDYAHNLSSVDPDHHTERSMAKVREQINKASSHRVSIILAMTSPGAYAELEEQRRRRRYAVISGLGEESFVPDDPESINIFFHRAARFGETDYSNSQPAYPVPYEWFHYEFSRSRAERDQPDETALARTRDNQTRDNQARDNQARDKKHKVIVLWLDESKFVSAPLGYSAGLLSQLLDKQTLDRHTVDVTLLGPSRSAALKNLVNNHEIEAHYWATFSGLLAFNIISSTATVDNTVLTQPPNARPLLSNYHDFDGNNDCVSGTFRPKKKGIACKRYLRTIQSDSVLIEKLTDELVSNRGFDPNSSRNRILLISESDTYFGRSLPQAFDKIYCDRATDKEACRRSLSYVSYQRGLDGIITGSTNTAKAATTRQTGNNGLIEDTDMRRPTGTAQFDYLRRLATDIRNRNEALRQNAGGGFRAVILLGSDVYDKLLVMRALRPELPGVLFATTDLNAQFLHPAEYNWARNLIIASTFNLSVSDKIPTRTMPLRDSYQTSVYLATRLIFNKSLQAKSELKQSRIDQLLPPQLLEVGRNTLVKLSDEIQPETTWNHLSTTSHFNAISTATLILALIGMFAFHQLKPDAHKELIVLSILIASFSWLSYKIATNNQTGEPYMLLSGTSIWPTVYIRLFCIIMALSFIWFTLTTLKQNWLTLGNRYFRNDKNEEYDGKPDKNLSWQRVYLVSASLIMLTVLLFRRELIPVFSGELMSIRQILGIPNMEFIANRLVSVTIFMFIIAAIWWLHIYGVFRWLFSHLFNLASSTTTAFGGWVKSRTWRYTSRHVEDDNRYQVRAVNSWGKSCTTRCRSAIDMWNMYGDFGTIEHRLMRATAYIIIYMAFASVIFTLLGSSASPCRGEFACETSSWVQRLAVMAMFVLLFLVVDAARLCISWVDSLNNKELDWNLSSVREHEQLLKLPRQHARAWILVHLIGERTDVITRLIYYPVIIILLMLLSRSTFFDNWDFPQALAIVVSMNFIIALGSIVVLNFAARSARDRILQDLEHEEIAGDRQTLQPSSSERHELIQQLSKLQTGAYLPVWQQPPVRATLMLLGGFALTFAEYFNVFL